MFKRIIVVLSLFCASFHSLCFSLDHEEKKGSLIVTYQTDIHAKHLDRIRFWVKDENHKQQLYPKKDSFVFDPDHNLRMVVIDDLLPGKYFVEFLVPNIDGYFDDVPVREVNIEEGEAVKIDQIIRAKSASLPNVVRKEQFSKKKGKLVVSYDGGGESVQVSLKSSDDNVILLPQSGIDSLIDFDNGKMIIANDIPEGTYLLELAIGDEILFNQEIKIKGGATQSIHQSLEQVQVQNTIEQIEEDNEQIEEKEEIAIENKTRVAIYTNTSKASFELINMDTHERLAGFGENYTFEGLPIGTYELVFSGQDLLVVPPKKRSLEVKDSEKVSVDVQYDLLGQLLINSNMQKASFTISEMDGNIKPIQAKITQGSGEWYLPPGLYRLTFNHLKSGSKPPKPMDVEIKPQETVKILADYMEH